MWQSSFNIRLIICIVLNLIVINCYADSRTSELPWQERPEWQQIFSAQQANGTIVIADLRQAQLLVYNAARAAQRYTPASTYKIPHTLMALDAGMISSAEQLFRWDGTEHSFKLHNQDQTLSSAMRYSAVWVYRELADVIGAARAGQYLAKLAYGNASVATTEGDYWIDGELAISAFEQVKFLQDLYAERLPFSMAHQQLVKTLLVNEQGEDWQLYAKTGWQGKYGWWVGWVALPAGPVFFALNIDTPNRLDDLPKRELIGRAVLRAINALPEDQNQR
ncbi:beta-lactamase [Alishewanella longhuensis]|uniref:Beta-lactamase n=1 Tax=Alishewanella longhuensis TaxID=1091037 RepID=A0ABQ3KXF0_9ALTE|nr:beta-lactamase [Alishewanella longhuensis]